MKKRIAWGTSKTLYLAVANFPEAKFEYILCDFHKEPEFCGIPVKRVSALRDENRDEIEIVVFAVSNKSLRAIFARLNELGFEYKKHFILYSDFIAENFRQSVKEKLGWNLDPYLKNFATSMTLNSERMVMTTIPGTWLLTDAMQRFNGKPGDIAEVGCFEGGNALVCLQSPGWDHNKKYYLFDTFEGFPEISEHDPQAFGVGFCCIETTVQNVRDTFAIHPEAVVVEGAIPGTFPGNVPNDATFSVVFYDCDLYQPAKDTLEYFWDRMEPGGVIFLHDYAYEPTHDFSGVKKAVDAFAAKKGVPVHEFWHNTMAAVQKPA